jgi:hypothetical protein
MGLAGMHVHACWDHYGHTVWWVLYNTAAGEKFRPCIVHSVDRHVHVWRLAAYHCGDCNRYVSIDSLMV